MWTRRRGVVDRQGGVRETVALRRPAGIRDHERRRRDDRAESGSVGSNREESARKLAHLTTYEDDLRSGTRSVVRTGRAEVACRQAPDAAAIDVHDPDPVLSCGTRADRDLTSIWREDVVVDRLDRRLGQSMRRAAVGLRQVQIPGTERVGGLALEDEPLAVG